MGDCIVLDDDDDVVMTEVAPTVEDEKKKLKFQKRLIAQVRRNRLIYDNRHKLFSDIEKKELKWQEIAKKLKSDVDTCKTSWIELRYKYQCHVRHFRKQLVNNPHKKRKLITKTMENELVFLYRMINDKKYCKLPYAIELPKKDAIIDDDLMIIEQPVELIVIEDDDSKIVEKPFKITKDMKVLVEKVKKYPELYNSNLAEFNDYTRKSYLWNEIAVQLGDKATKLMKSWILMVTRYEWEISRTLQNVDVVVVQTDLQKLLEYFEPYVVANPESVYKQSFYLKQAWFEPIDYFKDIYNLITRMKKIPDIVFLTDSLLTSTEKNKQFITMWSDLAKVKGNSPGQCETTWLIMRIFYWELMNMRQHKYQLTDKWYFETVITELYSLAQDSQLAKKSDNSNEKDKNTEQTDKTQKVYKRKHNQLTNKETTSSNNNSPVILNGTQMTTGPPTKRTTYSMQPLPAPPAPSPVVEQAPLPKITSAISLAPQGNLQVRPVKQINAAVAMSPPQQPVLSRVPNNPTTIQLPYSTTISIPPAAKIKTSTQNKPPQILNNTTNIRASLLPISINANNAANFSLQAPISTNTPQAVPMVCINASVVSNNITNSAPVPVAIGTYSAAVSPSKPVTADDKMPAVSLNDSIPSAATLTKTLNPNEILIELIASHNGNHLVVHGPPLSEKYHLSMPTVAKLIREVMAIPLLHNKRHNQPNAINSYWEHISKKFNLPAHICRACWNFLVENFNHFPQIAPMKELMKPFSTTLKVWTESNDLFKIFDQHAVANGWLKHIARLPEVVGCIGTYPALYKDVAKNATDASDMETLCIWRTISLRFPNINDISLIWTAFKNIFCQYMSDLEFGIDNKWHINWWCVLAKMKFLVETRYAKDEAFYYIVNNKMLEEIERCAMIEMKKRFGDNEGEQEDPKSSEPEKQVDQKPSTSQLNATADSVQLLSTPKQDVEMVALLTVIEKYPVIYEKVDQSKKFEAWKSVAKELKIDVTDCLLAFRRACQKYCAYKKQDPVSRCPLMQKYYKRLDTIFRNVKPITTNNNNTRKINIKTPFELNQSFEDEKHTAAAAALPATAPTEFVFPERYISDINMSNCDSDLVIKNWSYALGNISNHLVNEILHMKLKAILGKT